MSNKPHLFFRNPVEGVKTLRQRTRFAGADDENEEKGEVTDYTPKREDFIRSKANFLQGREARIAARNPRLQVPAHVEYMEIRFHDFFDTSFFENRYRANFGLSVVSYSDLNAVVMFAIVDAQLFQQFITSIDTFIATADHTGEVSYNTDIKYIKEFIFYTSDKIIQYREFKLHIVINLVDNVEMFRDYVIPIEQSLIAYLQTKDITYYEDLANGKLELLNVDEVTVREIADNFDIIQSINAYAAGIVRPNPFNIVERTFGFNITNAGDELPTIGIIDTGISNQTPLAGLIINQGNDFDITGTSPITDAVSHGTAVGALAALGNKLHPDHVGDFSADAKLLSIKILDTSGGYIPEAEVIRMIREANQRHGIKVFVLTICYTEPKTYNDTISEYAYALDVLAYELDILIFISIGNVEALDLQHYDGRRFVTVTYPDHFDHEKHNLVSPSESMNNVTVGAAAGNFEDNDQICVSPEGTFPAIYTRTHHVSWNHPSINKTRVNKRLFKPDICYYGGDLDDQLSAERAGLKVLSTRQGLFYDREIGTSYSAPLTANIAARLMHRYPDLRGNMQTIKALILNGAHSANIDGQFGNLENTVFKGIYGNGIPDIDSILYSDENRVTFILEDSIQAGQIKSYELKIPEYLLTVDRKNSLLHVDATLCFKFMPLRNNQLAYCPLHITFGVFRNLVLEGYQTDPVTGQPVLDPQTRKPISIGLNDNKTENYKFSESWAQDYYYKPKMLSNAQKLSFNVSKKVLQEENCILKIAVSSKLHKLVSEIEKNSYQENNPFSIAFTIRETPIRGANTSQLYDQLVAINQLETLATLDTDLEAEA